MQLLLNIPDKMAESIFLGEPEQDKRALELLALEGYRLGKLSRGQVSAALEMSFFETEEFLHRHGAFQPFSIEEYDQEAEDLRKFLQQ